MILFKSNLPERFWRNVHADLSGCWLWRGGTRHGYGVCTIDGVAKGAHRLAYADFRGPVPEALVVCHSCDVTNCVRPDHLWLGTQQDNVKDMFAKGRQPDRRSKTAPQTLAVLRVIARFRQKHPHYGPSIDEVRKETKYSTTSLVRNYMLRLQDQGLLDMDEGVARSAEPTALGWLKAEMQSPCQIERLYTTR